MPVLHNISLSLVMSEVLRRQGIRDYSKVRSEIKDLLSELLVGLSELHLLEPAIAYELYAVTRVNHNRMCLEGGTTLHGWLLSSVLPSAKELAVAVCTIGAKLEEKVIEFFGKGESLRGLLLDGIGNAAVDSLVQETCQFIKNEASSRGYQASSPLIPGMPGLPVSEQRQMFQLVPAEQIGVRLTSSAMMVPLKSLSMVVGTGPEMPTWTQAETCKRCSLSKTCLYKVQTNR